MENWNKPKAKVGKLILFSLLVILVVTVSVSAVNFDNRKGELQKGEGISNYGKIEIKDWFGLIDLVSLELKKNTDFCFSECSAEKEIIMHQSGVLIDDVRFETILYSGRYEEPILDYQFYVKNKVGGWRKYELGAKVDKGTYQVKLEGIKSPMKKVDWIIKSQGQWIDEWALWDNNLIYYWPFNETSSTNVAEDIIGNNNFTVNIGNFSLGGKIGNMLNSSGIGLNATSIANVNGNFTGTHARTINFWAYTNTLGAASEYYFWYGPETLNEGFGLGKSAANFWVIFGYGAANDLTTTTTATTGWHMHTAVYDGTTLTYYLDGSSIGTKTHAYASTADIIYLGTYIGQDQPLANITFDELGMWNRSLTGSEVFSLYNGGLGLAYGLIPTFELVYNSTVYETAQESYTLNITNGTSPTSAIFYYNNVSYSATKSSDYLFTSTVPGLPSNVGTAEFYWTMITGASQFNSTKYTQSLIGINLTLCNQGGGAVTYINFTFQDEETVTSMNAKVDYSSWEYWLGDGSETITSSFSNLTINPSYAFCFTPADKTVTVDLDFKYSNATHPQRTLKFNDQSLTNITTNQVLYLLGSGDGIYSSFQIVSAYGDPISGARVQIERQIGGAWVLISEGTSDSSGLTTFWLNSNYDHRITITKTGYVGTTETIRPTQAVYTIVLSGADSGGTYNFTLEGIYFTKTPNSGILSPGTYDFTFNVTAQNDNMENCKIELTNVSGAVLDSTISACTTNALLTISGYTITEGDVVYGKYYVDLGDGYIALETDASWFTLTTNLTGKSTLKGFFEYLSDPTIWVEEGSADQKKYEFTKFVAFFLILSIVLAYANYKTGFDNQNPGIVLFGLPFIMIFVSLAGAISTATSGAAGFFVGRGFFYMEGATTIAFFDNYLIAVYSLLIALGFYLATIRREG